MFDKLSTVHVVSEAIDAASDELRAINLSIYNNPELKFEEVKAAELLSQWFEARDGWSVKRGAYGLATAFEARLKLGEGGRTICFNAEYDALPSIGHGCGHNLIATSALASAIGVEAYLRAHSVAGTLIVLGTPAEETGGGKDLMAQQGAWSDCDASIMVHPFPNESAGRMSTRASSKFRVEYYGRPAHAAAAPWEGRNACDAIVQAYTGIAAYRQHLKHDSQSIQGVIISAGEAPNVIPVLAKGSFSIRTNTSAQLGEIRSRVEDIFAAAALATGCTHKVFWDCRYDDIVTNKTMCSRYEGVMKDSFGAQDIIPHDRVPQGHASSDFGNVTYICPGIQTTFSINAGDVLHTVGFRDAAGTQFAHDEALKTGKANAVVGVDLFVDDDFFGAAHSEWAEEMKRRSQR